MPRKEMDFDIVLKGCKNYSDAVAEIRRHAKMLQIEAESATATLKDEVASRNIERIENLSYVILKVTNEGEKRIRELERRVKKERDDYEQLR